MILYDKKVLATVDVLYWMPDYQDILQQFVWQTADIRPEYPRIHKFLNYWKDNIDAVIAEVKISDSEMARIRRVDKEWRF
jgi:uncharacterized protein Usg